MEDKEEYELILNHLTTVENLMGTEDTFTEYKQTAFFWLNKKGRHLFAEDILKQFGKGITLEELFEQDPERFISGITMQNGNKTEQTWYDTLGMDVIEVKDMLFDYFFVCKIRHLDILAIDDYLSYHLEKSFEENTEKFHRFLLLTTRKYKKLLEAEHTETINEWMTSLKTKTELSGVQILLL